jgi:hypothetical protein
MPVAEAEVVEKVRFMVMAEQVLAAEVLAEMIRIMPLMELKIPAEVVVEPELPQTVR